MGMQAREVVVLVVLFNYNNQGYFSLLLIAGLEVL